MGFYHRVVESRDIFDLYNMGRLKSLGVDIEQNLWEYLNLFQQVVEQEEIEAELLLNYIMSKEESLTQSLKCLETFKQCLKMAKLGD